MNNPKSEYFDPSTLPLLRRINYEFWFWLHIVVYAGIVLGCVFFAPLWAVILVYVTYELHLIVLKGCILTKIQQKFEVLSNNEEYYHAIFRRLFKYDLTDYQTYLISIIVLDIALILAVVLDLLKN